MTSSNEPRCRDCKWAEKFSRVKYPNIQPEFKHICRGSPPAPVYGQAFVRGDDWCRLFELQVTIQ